MGTRSQRAMRPMQGLQAIIKGLGPWKSHDLTYTLIESVALMFLFYVVSLVLLNMIILTEFLGSSSSISPSYFLLILMFFHSIINLITFCVCVHACVCMHV